MYYMGFHQMYRLLKLHIREEKNQKWVKLFRMAYVTGTVSWAYRFIGKVGNEDGESLKTQKTCQGSHKLAPGA